MFILPSKTVPLIPLHVRVTAFVTTLTQPACHSVLNSTEKHNEHGCVSYYCMSHDTQCVNHT